MPLNNKTYKPLNYFTITAGADLEPNRFVSFGGIYPGEESKALGVTDSKWIQGEKASVITLGIAILEVTGAINAGDRVATDTDGKAKKGTSAMQVNGRALDTTTGPGFIRVLLVP